MVNESSTSTEEWNSHRNMEKLTRNRTKLETPNGIDLSSYANAKTKDFIEKYKSHNKGHLYQDGMVYTQPYSSGHYSEPHGVATRVGRKHLTKKITTNVDAYTSITSSDLFLSSNSVYVPGENSTSNTTTHQYDHRPSVAVQTTDSLMRTTPIFGQKKHCRCTRECVCHCRAPSTVRVNKNQHNKQQQIVPEPVAYVLTFESTSRSSNQPDDPYYEKESTIPDLHIPIVDNRLTLQQHLKNSCPKFVSHAEERRQCLQELNLLRKKRNEQRNKLFALSSNTSLRTNLKYLSPPPLSSRRVFNTKTIKASTRRRYQQLPEVRRKDEINRQNKIKQSNRILTDMFNRNLQRHVLRGQTNLSNSMTVAPM